MRQRFSQTLPLIGTLCLLIIGSAVLFKFTPPADATMDAQAIGEPPSEITSEITKDVEITAETIDPTSLVDDLAELNQEQATVDEIYFAANEIVVLDQYYSNDVYVAGETITVTGTIEGDLFAAGNTVIVQGDVLGSIRAAGSVVKINGQVGRNVMVFAERLQFGSDTRVMKDVLFAAQLVENDGAIFGNILGSAETFAQTGTVYGTVEVDDMVEVQPEPKPIVTPFNILKLFICWLGLIALGLVVLHLFAKFSRNVVEHMRKKPGQSFGYGTLVILLGPAALLILSITLIGLPLAMVAGLLWIVLVVIAKLYFGTALGQLLLPKSPTLVWPFVLGFSLVYLVTKIIGWFGWAGVVIGCLIMLSGIIWASGAIVQQCRTK